MPTLEFFRLQTRAEVLALYDRFAPVGVEEVDGGQHVAGSFTSLLVERVTFVQARHQRSSSSKYCNSEPVVVCFILTKDCPMSFGLDCVTGRSKIIQMNQCYFYFIT